MEREQFKTYEPLPVGRYIAQTVDVTIDDGIYGPQVKLQFELLDPKYEGRTVTGWASKNWTARAKIYSWAKALLPPDILQKQVDLGIDYEVLFNRLCWLTLTIKENDKGERFNRIDSIGPARKDEVPEEEIPY